MGDVAYVSKREHQAMKDRIVALEGFLRRMLPDGIENACDECGGSLGVCLVNNPDCPIREAREFLASSVQETEEERAGVCQICKTIAGFHEEGCSNASNREVDPHAD